MLPVARSRNRSVWVSIQNLKKGSPRFSGRRIRIRSITIEFPFGKIYTEFRKFSRFEISCFMLICGIFDEIYCHRCARNDRSSSNSNFENFDFFDHFIRKPYCGWAGFGLFWSNLGTSKFTKIDFATRFPSHTPESCLFQWSTLIKGSKSSYLDNFTKLCASIQLDQLGKTLKKQQNSSIFDVFAKIADFSTLYLHDDMSECSE